MSEETLQTLQAKRAQTVEKNKAEAQRDNEELINRTLSIDEYLRRETIRKLKVELIDLQIKKL